MYFTSNMEKEGERRWEGERGRELRCGLSYHRVLHFLEGWPVILLVLGTLQNHLVAVRVSHDCHMTATLIFVTHDYHC